MHADLEHGKKKFSLAQAHLPMVITKEGVPTGDGPPCRNRAAESGINTHAPIGPSQTKCLYCCKVLSQGQYLLAGTVLVDGLATAKVQDGWETLDLKLASKLLVCVSIHLQKNFTL